MVSSFPRRLFLAFRPFIESFKSSTTQRSREFPPSNWHKVYSSFPNLLSHEFLNSERVALEALKAAGWNLQRSLDSYFNHENSRAPVRGGSSRLDKRNLERLWTRYRAPHEDRILAEGVSQFCEDLQVNPTDIALVKRLKTELYFCLFCTLVSV